MADRGRTQNWDDEWQDSSDDEPPRPRRRKGPLRRLMTLVKATVFFAPLGFFLYGTFLADCRARPALGDWTAMIGATACARSEMLGQAATLPENFASLRRLLD